MTASMLLTISAEQLPGVVSRTTRAPTTSSGKGPPYWDTFIFCGVEFIVELIPHTTSGYYEGFNLDFDISLRSNEIYGDYDNLSDFISDVGEFIAEGNKGLRLNLSNLHRRLEALLSEMIDEVESVFECYSEPLAEKGSFSNGETLYKKAN